VSDQQKRRQVYDDDGKPVYNDDGTPMLEEAVPPPGSLRRIADLGIGGAKALGRMGVDTLKMVALGAGPVGMLGDKLYPEVRTAVIPALEPSNDIQRYAGTIADIATMAAPGFAAARGSSKLPRLARAVEKRAVPGLTDAGADYVLDKGIGIVSKGNAAKFQSATPAHQSSQVRQQGGRWVNAKPPKPHRLQPDADAFTKAANKPTQYPTRNELGASLGGGFLAQSPEVTMALGVAHALARPLPSSIIAQGVRKGAPLIQGAAGGAATLGAGSLARSAVQIDPAIRQRMLQELLTRSGGER
jgi:hypothetical protein